MAGAVICVRDVVEKDGIVGLVVVESSGIRELGVSKLTESNAVV
jgi:hypothetical protein